MDNCQHEKIYANDMLLSNPPQQNWICRKCGEQGTDTIGSYIGGDRYSDLVRKFANAETPSPE